MDDRDLRERMEGLARRVDGAAAPDLHVARARATRRRTTSALVVGLSVAVAGAVLAFSALRPAPEAPILTDPDWVLPAEPTVWPTADVPDDASYRQDPEQLIRRFAATVLGWSEPRIAAVGADRYTLEPPCPDTARCVEGLNVTVVQADPAGPWSIVRVSNAELVVGSSGDPLVVDGPTLSFDITIPDYRSAHVGIVATNGCRDASSYQVGLDAGSLDLDVPEPAADDPACSDVGAGYAFVYVTDDTTEPVGDPLLEAAAIEYPWLTIVPIHLVMESGGETASATVAPAAPGATLTVTCDGEGTMIDRAQVIAGPAGAAISPSSDDPSVRLFIDVDGDEVLVLDEEAGTLDLAPGMHTVGCAYGGDVVGEVIPFEVVDPDGHWFDPERWECDGPIVDHDPITVRYEDQIAKAAIEWFGADPNGPSVSVVPVGYPDSQTGQGYAVFDTEQVALAPLGIMWFEPDGSGWTSVDVWMC